MAPQRLTRYEAEAHWPVARPSGSALSAGVARGQVLVEQVAHAKVRGVLHQKLHNVPGAVHDGADLLETPVDQRHAVPLENLIGERNETPYYCILFKSPLTTV